MGSYYRRLPVLRSTASTVPFQTYQRENLDLNGNSSRRYCVGQRTADHDIGVKQLIAVIVTSVVSGTTNTYISVYRITAHVLTPPPATTRLGAAYTVGCFTDGFVHRH